MQISLNIPLRIFQSWTYFILVISSMIFILLPSSIYLFVQYKSTLIPTPPPLLNLQFQYIESTGPFAFYNLTNSAYDQIKGWKKSNTNIFTKIEQVLTINVKYLKLNKDSTIGGVRISIYDNKNPPVMIQDNSKKSTGKKWPFKELSLINDDSYNIYRIDKRFSSWNEVVGKSYSRGIPFISSHNDELNINGKVNVLQYFLPQWMLNIFVPIGVQELFSWKNVNWLLGQRDRFELDSDDNFKNLKTVDLLDSFGDFKNLKSNSFSTGLLLFEGQLLEEDFQNTSLLVELDLDDIYILNAHVKFDYVLSGLRWWLYWWPGLCFIIGVGIIWSFSCLSCLFISYLGLHIWNILFWLVFGSKK